MEFITIVDFIDGDTDPIAYRIEAAGPDEAYEAIADRHAEDEWLDITFVDQDEATDAASIQTF